MGPAPGTRDDNLVGHGRLSAAGRTTAFVVMAALAMLIVAGTTLLPAYADMQRASYRRDCEQTKVADLERLSAANDRMIAAAERGDPLLTRRFAARQLGITLTPIAMEAADLRGSTAIIDLPPTARPDPPDGWAMRMGCKLKNVGIRRGLMLLAGGSLLVAMLCFVRPGRNTPDRAR